MHHHTMNIWHRVILVQEIYVAKFVYMKSLSILIITQCHEVVGMVSHK